MMNQEVEFRKSQKQIIEAIMKRKSRVLKIMPTRGGKSLTFMLSTFYSDNEITIVVMSLIVLKQNITRRCRELRIRVRIWNSKRSLSQMPTGYGRPYLMAHRNFVGEGKYARAGIRRTGIHI